MGRMAERWAEELQERVVRECDEFDWQAALMADPAHAEWLDSTAEERE